MHTQSRKRGSAIAFGTVLALALVVLGVGFLFLILYMGGQNETKNAVDAGVLNIGKQVIDNITVDLNGSEEQQIFYDCTATNANGYDKIELPVGGKVSLRTINRVWGKAMLIAANAKESGSGQSNADKALQGAADISKALADKLKTASNLYTFFTDFAQANSVRMIGTDVKVNVLPGANWQTSLLERDFESNIQLNPGDNNGLPPGVSFDTNSTTPCMRNPVPAGAGGVKFLKGYSPITMGNGTFWQVPFAYDEKPHLVARSTFDSNSSTAKPITWNDAVPNGFSAEGAAVKSGPNGERAISWVMSNPRQPFQLSMPHSFMKIHLDELRVHFMFFPAPAPAVEMAPSQSYDDYTPSSVTGAPAPAGGVLCSTVTPDSVEVGLDVVGRPLDQLIFGPPGGDTAHLEALMTNRMNEMLSKPGSTANMHSVLNDPLTIGYILAGERDFYVFSTDGENLTVLPKYLALPMAPWLLGSIDNNPDGSESKLVDDTWIPAPIFFSPIVTPDPFCTEFLALGWGTWDKDLYWTPGTGYNKCLGTVRVKRWTDVYSLGICVPVI